MAANTGADSTHTHTQQLSFHFIIRLIIKCENVRIGICVSTHITDGIFFFVFINECMKHEIVKKKYLIFPSIFFHFHLQTH